MLLAIAQVNAQERTITGTVTAEKDAKALPGVSVLIKGTAAGSTTNGDGTYSIQVPNNTVTLVYSIIGFASQEVAVNKRSSIDVALSAEIKGLDEVVVVGYGTQRKRDLTGAISSVKAEDLVLSGGPDIGNMLKGKAAGLLITQNSAQPGGGLDILIRGAGSINASNDPLIVVDGFPISDLQQPETGGRY